MLRVVARKTESFRSGGGMQKGPGRRPNAVPGGGRGRGVMCAWQAVVSAGVAAQAECANAFFFAAAGHSASECLVNMVCWWAVRG